MSAPAVSVPLGAGDVVGGRYEIVRRLGEGAMGAVFEARAQSTGRRVALKVIVEELLRHSKARARFEIEAKASGSIDSEHVVQLLDVGVDEARGAPFLAMELLAGRDLEALLLELGPLAPDLVVRLGIQACLGLERAHSVGVLHRDIKPANLFLADRDGGEVRLKLVDFGIAKILAPEEERVSAKGLTRTGQLLGSPLYMSPEQVYSGKGVDARTDVWSLGVVLYEALVGAAPFQHLQTVPELLVSIGSVPVAPIRSRAPWVPEPLAAAVERALCIDKSARYEGAEAMRQALSALAPGGWSVQRHHLVGRGAQAGLAASPPGPIAPLALSTTAAVSAPLAPTPVGGLVRLPVAPPPTVALPLHRQTVAEGPQPAALVAPPAREPRRRGPGVLVLGLIGLGGAALGALALRTILAPTPQARASGSREDASGQASVHAVAPHVEPPATAAHRVPHAPAAASSEPAASHASPLLVSLEGRWVSSARKRFDAVRTDEGLEFRVVDPASFGAQAYTLGERRFTLHHTGGELLVTDHFRPATPEGAHYSAGGRSACQRSFDGVQAGGKLHATVAAGTLSVELVSAAVQDAGYTRSGPEIVACPGLDTAVLSVVHSTLTREAK